jgi:hypothetical protein
MKVVDKNGKRYIFDEIRKKYLLLTPEEEVRQQVIQFLIHRLDYPRAAISVEKSIRSGGRMRRYDIVVYAGTRPWLIVECKARSVALKQDTFDQIGQYNYALRVPYLYITNGDQHFVLQIDFETGNYEFLEKMPAYPSQDT